MFSSIRLVEIEIHSFCNRKCAWCPNSIINRNVCLELTEDLYIKVLHELRRGNFTGAISYSRYNEPMARIELLKKRLKQAKEILPNIKRVCNTNGDYLSEKNLKNLLIDELTIMDYDCIGLPRCQENLTKIKAEIIRVDYPYIYAQYANTAILYYVDWPSNGLITDRGGSLHGNVYRKGNKLNLINAERHIPCYEPQYFIGIDFNGDVTPCCQIRGDNPDQRKFILGNINQHSLSKIFFSQKATEFRNSISSDEFTRYPETCKNCSKSPGRYTRNNPGITY